MRLIDADVLEKKLKDAIEIGRVYDLDGASNFHAVLSDVEHMPTIEPEPQWIPVTERLPEYDGAQYIVTVYCEKVNTTRVRLSYCYINDYGFWSDVPSGFEVIAWMPLPKPWKGWR